MVPLSVVRHRLTVYEIPEVIRGLDLLLRKLLKERREEERAEVAFRCFYRLLQVDKGRPDYPEFTWDNLDRYLNEVAPYALKSKIYIKIK